MNILLDGPVEVQIDGDRVVIYGASDGQRVCFTMRLQDALISAHRFEKAYESRETGEIVQVDFGRRDQADTA
jgi:hypothetical protein